MKKRTNHILLAILYLAMSVNRIEAQTDAQFDSLDAFYAKKDYAAVIQLCDRVLMGDSGQFNAWGYKGAAYLDQKKYREAAACYGHAAYLNPVSSYLTNAAYCNLMTGAFDSTEAFCRRAIIHYPEDFNHYLNLAHSFYLRDQLTEAAYYYEMAMAYLPAHEQFFQGVEGDIHLLDSLKPSSFITDIREFFHKGFEAVKGNTASNIILDSIYVAMLNDDAGKNNKLLRLKREFIVAQGDEHIRRFQVLRDFHYAIAQYEMYYDSKKFRDYLETGFAIDIYLRDSLSLFNSLLHFSHLSIAAAVNSNKFQPEYQEAKKLAEDALRYADTFHLPQKYLAWIQLGDVYNNANMNELAIKNYLRAMEFIPKTNLFGKYEETATCILSCYSALEKYAEADKYYDLVMKRAPLIADPDYELLTAHLQYLRSLYFANKYADVIERFHVIRGQYKVEKKTCEELSGLYQTAGICHRELGHADSAILYLKEAVRLFNQYSILNRGVFPDFSSAERKEAIVALRELYAKKGDIASAFEWAERTKENLLTYWIGNDPNPEKVQPLSELQKEMPPDAAALVYFNFNDREGISLGFNSADQRLIMHDSAEIQTAFRKEKDYKSILKGGLKVENGITFLPLKFYSFLSRQAISVRGVLPVSKKSDKPDDPDEWRITVSKLLYRFYIKPYESLLEGKKTIYICADEALNYIPFEAMMDESGVYFGDKYSVIYVPSFTIQKMLAKRKIASGHKMILFGNPDYSTYHPEKHSALAWDFAEEYGIKNWADLPGTKMELDTLSLLWKNSLSYQQKKLSESEIKELSRSGNLKDARIIHFALHGFSDISGGPDGNTMIVTEPDDGNEDGLLNYWEASNLDIQPRLVCLSACETAFGIPRDDGSTISMTGAFLVAGAAACLGTNWSISDRATMLFMREFYKLMLDGVEIPEALHRVKKKFISGAMGEEYKSPYYWAPFKYYGM